MSSVFKDIRGIDSCPMATLESRSWSDSDGAPLVTLQNEAIDMDAIAMRYNAGIKGLHETPQSIDAIFLAPSGECAFVEFKNEGMDGRLPFEVRRKVYDTLLLLGDVCGLRISDTRMQAVFILVYSSDKTDYDKLPPANSKKAVSYPPSWVSVGKSLARPGNDSFVQFGLGTLRGFCFKSVYTYSEAEFEEAFAGIAEQGNQAKPLA